MGNCCDNSKKNNTNKNEEDKKSMNKVYGNSAQINSKIKALTCVKEESRKDLKKPVNIVNDGGDEINMEISDPNTKLGNNSNELLISSEQSEKISKQSKLYICKIKINSKFGTGFLCKIPFPDKNNCLSVLMSNCHVVEEKTLFEEKKLEISFDDDKIKRIINITHERKIYSIKEKESYDLTILEIYPEEDKIFHFFEIETINVTQKFTNEPIYILQYPAILDEGRNQKSQYCSISYGKIVKINKNEIFHDCSTQPGSSGGPILLLKNYKIIGIHKARHKYIKLNIGTSLKEQIEIFGSVFADKAIKNNYANCIICEYNIKNNEEEFDLLYDYNKQNLDISNDNELINFYNIGKEKKQILENKINIYVDDQLINFSFKYKTNKNVINVKFIFNEKINDLSFLFYKCKYLKSVDLSPFNSSNVNNISHMFSGCESLEYIDFFSFNTSNIKSMRGLFSDCRSLETIDLSTFDTKNVTNMSQMFYNSSIITLDLTNFNTLNVTNMSKLFANCHFLRYLYFNSFKTDNVTDMSLMFSRCSAIKSLDLSHFNTSKVTNMNGMFEYCPNLEFLNVSSFNTLNVKNIGFMFICCMSLKSLDLSSFDTRNVENMESLFFNSVLLESLDLSSFTTINAKYMSGMFTGCINLKNVKCNDNNIILNKQKIFFIF